MDRNGQVAADLLGTNVALRKESVDRNIRTLMQVMARLLSLSARRAWIEIPEPCGPQNTRMPVALRKESVDRNDVLAVSAVLELMSLSARRAWIEISSVSNSLPALKVALRKESVDRNDEMSSQEIFWAGRSPQGERG